MHCVGRGLEEFEAKWEGWQISCQDQSVVSEIAEAITGLYIDLNGLCSCRRCSLAAEPGGISRVRTGQGTLVTVA